ncbi:MAG: TIGR04282 family arsenosugar biosynthesis glycosyltransferase [Proteobacteria bacterium]|nr:TIGR04282 family arsenosugar biosynthesis glycosyltransferase [Pseudomonadota bacterium]MBU1596540.1 TIGR04282 family arsenosugar biosynthesis glycosyltransferase [Pseudomonadota bacterium]
MRRVIVFLKYPEAGQVKTRLAADIGGPAAARLARHFAEATLAAAAGLGLPVSVCYAPSERGPDITAWLGPGLDYAPQQGADLGQRMRKAFAAAFALGAERAVLVGTDAPDRPVEFFSEALERLDDHDVVLGPALDGGYHLIAMQRDRFAPEAFAGIEWSSPRVLAQTLDALRAARRKAHMLPPWRDIDDAAGLADYLEAQPEAAALLAGPPGAEKSGDHNDHNNDHNNAAILLGGGPCRTKG